MDIEQPPSYNEGDFNAFIPFVNETDNCFTENVRLKIQVPKYSGYVGPNPIYEHCPPMDTGSTGLSISAIDLGYTSEDQLEGYEKGIEYLSSSKIFYQGYWVPTTVTFPDGNISAEIKILAVTHSRTCGRFNDTTGKCDEFSDDIPGDFPPKISYLGVGFGRLSTQQPGGKADNNPLLNLVNTSESINGLSRSIRRGYVITEKGVWVGLAKSNTNGFSFMKLSPNPQDGPPTQLPEWSAASAFIDYYENMNMPGTVLFDTGITQSYLETEAFQNPSHPLSNGKHYAIKIGNSADTPIEALNITVGDTADPITPSAVYALRRVPAFVNTGRFFFRSFDVLFDAEEGWLGLRKHTPCIPSNAS